MNFAWGRGVSRMRSLNSSTRSLPLIAQACPQTAVRLASDLRLGSDIPGLLQPDANAQSGSDTTFVRGEPRGEPVRVSHEPGTREQVRRHAPRPAGTRPEHIEPEVPVPNKSRSSPGPIR